MEYINAIILGIVQGLTEFIPVSSSGHLVVLHQWLQVPTDSDLIFDVALHVGTLFALLIFFAKDIIHYARKSQKVLYYLVIASIPAGLIGLLLEDWIDQTLRSPWVVITMLVIVSGIFFWVEHSAQQTKTLPQITWKHALLMGFAQSIALIPGTSRSGITISAGLQLGLTRVDAARFSFLMAIPITGAATVKELYDVMQLEPNQAQLVSMGLGMLAAFIVGIMAIRYLLIFFQRYSLRAFAWYRLGLALVVSLVLLL